MKTRKHARSINIRCFNRYEPKRAGWTLAALTLALIMMIFQPAALAEEISAPVVIEPSQSLPLPTASNPSAELSPAEIDWRDPGLLAPESWPSLDKVRSKVKAFVVIDRLTGTVILEKDETTPQFPASTTKIMTALLALEKLSLDQQILVSQSAVDLPWDASKAGLLAGEVVSVRDLLASLMLPSGNDAANVLAEGIAGDQASFADLMNARAAELGASQSFFVNANGLHDELHQMSAGDLAKITAEAMRYPTFRELIDTPVYAMRATLLHPANGWAIYTNSNARLLLSDDSNYQSDRLTNVTGVKTGSTKAAGNCLVSAATTTAGQELICVLFGVDPEDSEGNVVSYSRTLLSAAADESAKQSSLMKLLADPALDYEIPDTDYRAIVQRPVTMLQSQSKLPDYRWIWPNESECAQKSLSGEPAELQLADQGQVVLTIPIRISQKPDLLESLINSESDSKQTATPSLWDWPLLRPLLASLFALLLAGLAYLLGFKNGRRG